MQPNSYKNLDKPSGIDLILTLLVPIPDEKKKIKINFYFHTSLWSLKRFYKGLKSLYKTFSGATRKCENKNLTWFLFQYYNFQKFKGRWVLTNSSSRFQSSCAIETGLSDFHKMTIMVMKTTFQKLKPKLIYYRDYNMFSNDKFREELSSKLSMENISNTSNSLENFL